MSRVSRPLVTLGVMTLAWGAGCNVGPDYMRPPTAATDAVRFAWQPDGLTDVNDAEGASAWWRSFNDPVIDDLVTKVLAKNTDLLAAAAAVLRAEALLRQAQGMRLPDLSYQAAVSRDKMSFGGAFTFLNTAYPHGFTVSYVADLFGRLRRSERAARWDLLATEDDRRVLLHALVAQAVQLRIQIATQQRLTTVAQATIANWESALEITQNRYEGGLVSPLDVYFARQNLTSAKVRYNVVEQQRHLLGHALSVLCGERPQTQDLPRSLAQFDRLPPLPPLAPVPLGLPAALLDRRPDVHAAEMRLAAATERVGVSIAQMYPDLTFLLSGGYQPFDRGDILNSQNQVYSAAMRLAAPLYRGGQLKAGVKAARAAVEQAAQRYAGEVLTAFQEVEDALMSQRLLQERIAYLGEGFQLAREAEALARSRYATGVEPMLVVLETERNRRLAENELVLAQGRLWETRVQLYLALGGDWLEAPDQDPTEPDGEAREKQDS